jgi:hypothetical protein
MEPEHTMMLIRHFISEGRYEDAITQTAMPGMSMYRGRLGRNALGEAVVRKAPLWVIEQLLMMCPDAVCNLDVYGNTILHLAIVNEHPDQIELVKMLLTAFPDAAAIKDRDGFLPIFTSVIRHPNLACFHLLCDAHPTSLVAMDDCGRTLLHHAVLRSFDISAAIMVRRQDAIRKADSAGWHPLHIFCNETGEENGKAREIFWLIYYAYPEAAHAPLDKEEDGSIVHLAVQNRFLPEDIKIFLLKQCPESAAMLAGRDGDGRPFVPNQFAL